MLWVLVLLGIAVVGLAMAAAYARWLAHRTSDVLAETRVLLGRLDTLAETLGEIRLPNAAGDGTDPSRDTTDRHRALSRLTVAPHDDLARGHGDVG